jgi:uncharacterized membrane protein
MSELHAVVARFPTPIQAEDAIRAIKDGGVNLADQAVVVKGKEGALTIGEGKDAGGGKGFVYGALAAGVLGVLAGPVGWAGLLAGGAAGGLAAKFHDAGIPTERLQELGESLQVGEAAAVAVARTGDEGIVRDTFHNYGGEAVTVTLTESVRTALESAAPGAS